MKKHHLFFILLLFLGNMIINAQVPSLEFALGDGNPTGNGPVQNTNIRFRYNSDNYSGNTFQTYNQVVTADFQLTNQQYSLSTISTNVPANLGYTNAPSGGSRIFAPLSNLGSPSASWFTSYGAPAGSGISTSGNYGVALNIATSPLRAAGAATGGVQHQMADLVVTFSHPVSNPILHIGGMGSRSLSDALGFSQEYEIISSNVPVTLTRLSGSNSFGISGSKINNTAAYMNATGTDNSGSGSVRINGSGITSLTFRVYLRGDGSYATPDGWSGSGPVTTSGDGATLSFSIAGDLTSPGGVSGANFWVKSDDAGTIATAWKDHSANADNIPNVGGMTLSPADRAHNFHPYTSGYSSAKYFHNNTSVMNPLGNVEYPNISTSVFSAVRPTTLAAGRIIGIDNDAANAAEPGVSITAAGNPRQYEFFNTTTSSDFSTAFNVGQSNIFSALANNTVANGGTSAISGGEKRLGLNGSYQVFSGFGATNKFQIYGTNLRLGYATFDAAGAFPGDIMEIVWYNRTLTANEQSRVNSYLAVKNGVTFNEDYLNSDSNVIWSRTDNAGYNNNIFGIGRDDLSALHQKQSGSVNSGQQLVISTLGLADSNAANNSNVFEGTFLLVGDNGLKQSLTTPLSYTVGSNGVANFRFESIWKEQNTGTVGPVTVAWPKGITNMYLVQSPNAVFGDGDDVFTPMTTEMTVNGVVYNTANVTLLDDQFFTFAGFGNAPGGVATGLSYWYRADVDATNTGVGTDVTAWKDVWNGTTVAQLGTNPLPKYVVGATNYFNFNPGVNFTAGTQSLGNINVRTFSADSYDVFTFTKELMTSGGTHPSIFRSLVDNAFLTGGIRRWDGLGIVMDNRIERLSNTGGTTDYYGTPAGTFSTTIPSIMYHTFTALATTRALNGAANFATTNHSGTGVRNLNGGHLFGNSQFSSNGSDNQGFIGHLGETIIYGANNLSATERRKVDSYLGIKYGITLGQVNTDHYLDANGTLVWNGGTNTTYNNNIFGVAREDIGLFEQKVSRSVNAGTILTLATINNFVLPNLDASRTGFANDKTYFLLGDNNNVTTTPVAVTINGIASARIQRVWMAQEKDADAGALFFEADLTAYNAGSFDTTQNMVMLVADDAAFTTNLIVVPAVSNIASKWVFNQNVADGKFITFAKNPCYGPDTDGDGIADMCDLDSDNDGILDTDECWDSTSAVWWSHNDGTRNSTITNSSVISFGLASTNGSGLSTTLPNNYLVVTGVSAATYSQAITNNEYIEYRFTTANWPAGEEHYYSSTNMQFGIALPSASHRMTVAISSDNFATSTITINDLQFIQGFIGPIENFNKVKLTPNTVYRTRIYFYQVTGGSGATFVHDDFNIITDNYCDTDGDGIPNYLDLDSDNDGCLDAIEGGAGFTAANLVNAGGTVTVGTGSSAPNQNLGNTVGNTATTMGIPTIAGTGQRAGSAYNAAVSNCISPYCYKPGITVGTALDTKAGITALSRAGADNPDNWPMVRKGGWLALESKTKAFVPNRVAFSGGNPVGITTFVLGMMVYDTTNKCMKMYTQKEGDALPAWHCISTQTCPD